MIRTNKINLKKCYEKGEEICQDYVNSYLSDYDSKEAAEYALLDEMAKGWWGEPIEKMVADYAVAYDEEYSRAEFYAICEGVAAEMELHVAYGDSHYADIDELEALVDGSPVGGTIELDDVKANQKFYELAKADLRTVMNGALIEACARTLSPTGYNYYINTRVNNLEIDDREAELYPECAIIDEYCELMYGCSFKDKMDEVWETGTSDVEELQADYDEAWGATREDAYKDAFNGLVKESWAMFNDDFYDSRDEFEKICREEIQELEKDDFER